MAVNSPSYMGPFTQDSGRGCSESIWGDCPLGDLTQSGNMGLGAYFGTHFFDDFEMAGQPTLNANSSLGKWACWADTNSVFADAGLEGGTLKWSNATNNKQLVLASNTGSFRFCSGATNYPYAGKMWFEARLAVDSITTAMRDIFCGLCDHTSTQITSANALVVATAGNTLTTTKGLIGFHFRATTNPTDVGIAHNVAGGTVQYLGSSSNLQKLSTNYGPSGGQALTVYSATSGVAAANTFIKLGWVFDPNAPIIQVATAVGSQTAGTFVKPVLQFFVNGQRVPVFFASTEIQATTFPVNFMSPTVVFNSVGSSPGCYIDWIRVAQLGQI